MAVNIRESVFDELTDFIISQPSLEAMAAYHASEEVENRVHFLLEKNREEGLTPDEREEMQHFLAIDHFLTLLKAKARLRLAKKS
jgi:hypothetical protein